MLFILFILNYFINAFPFLFYSTGPLGIYYDAKFSVLMEILSVQMNRRLHLYLFPTPFLRHSSFCLFCPVLFQYWYKNEKAIKCQ